MNPALPPPPATPPLVCRFLWFAMAGVLVFASAPAVRAQQPDARPTPSPSPVPPSAQVSEVAKAEGDIMVFAVRLRAGSDRILSLKGTRAPLPRGTEPQEGDEDEVPFSLQGSTLTDLRSGQEFPTLPSLPSSPYFGPMSTLGDIAPRGWLQMGMAFPALPPPPHDENGEPQPYLLRLQIPQLNLASEFALDPETLQPITVSRTP